MDARILALLRTPGGGSRLRLENERLVAEDGRSFEIRDGIPRILNLTNKNSWGLFYDAGAFAYDAILNFGERIGLGSEEKIRSELLGKLNLPADAVVLDLGCGTGSSRSAFGRDVTYIGFDLSLQMLKRAVAKNESSGLSSVFIQAAAEQLPIASDCADSVVAMGVMQHVPTPGIALHEAARALKLGASLLLIDERRSLPAITKKLGGQTGDVRQLSQWLQTANLHTDEQGEIGEYYYLSLRKKV